MNSFRRGPILYTLVLSITRGPRIISGLFYTWFFRAVLLSCGKHSFFCHGVYISHPKRVSVGDSCFIGSEVTLSSETSNGWALLGNNVQISEKCRIDMSGGISIGEKTLLSAGVQVYSHEHGYEPRSVPISIEIEIGSNVWIGTNSIILPSVKRIGNNAVIGAGSIVTKPVQDNAVVAGNPARVIKFRKPVSD